MDKTELRKKMRQQRNDLGWDEISHYSKIISDKVKELAEFQQAERIMIYLPFRNEVDTAYLLTADKKYALPVIDENKLLICEYSQDFVKNRYGIFEPRDRKEVAVDLIIVPGLAFDRERNRLGYGKGHYDKLLPELNIPAIALAYDFQIVEKLPAEEHDIKMTKIVTEKRII